jgi:hypothetical protein
VQIFFATSYSQVSGTILGLLFNPNPNFFFSPSWFLLVHRIGFVIGSGATLKIPIMEIARVIASNH